MEDVEQRCSAFTEPAPSPPGWNSHGYQEVQDGQIQGRVYEEGWGESQVKGLWNGLNVVYFFKT